jgi:hypothetical protein
MTTTPGVSGTRTAGDRADDVKGTVAEQTGQVAGTARDQAKQVASEASDRARDLAAEARTQLRDQTDTQRRRLAGTLHELGDELRSMADQGDRSGVGTELARQAAGRVHGLGDYVERHQPGDLLDDVRAFARRRPGTFLLAAAAAGVVAGRLTRGAAAASSTSGGTSNGISGDVPGRTPAASPAVCRATREATEARRRPPPSRSPTRVAPPVAPSPRPRRAGHRCHRGDRAGRPVTHPTGPAVSDPVGPGAPRVSDRSFGELVGELSNDLSRLVRQEIQLAKVETREDLAKAGRGAGMLGGAGIAGLLTLLFLSLALMFALATVMDVGWAALTVGVLWGVAAAVLAVAGRSGLRRATPPLEETTETLKEDARWVRRQNS